MLKPVSKGHGPLIFIILNPCICKIIFYTKHLVTYEWKFIVKNPQITGTINKKTFKYNEKGDKGGSHLTKIRYMLYLVLVIP